MLELIRETFLTQRQLDALTENLSSEAVVQAPLANPVEAAASISHHAVHWTKGFRDPLGDALARIQLGQSPSATAISIAVNLPSGPMVAPAPLVEQSLESQDSAISLQSSIPATLPMFDSKQSSTVSADLDAQLGNRRKFPRRHSECTVAIVSREDTIDLTPREIDWLLQSCHSVGRLQNLSQLGICLLLHKEVSTGTEVVLRISNEQIQRNVDMSARVVRCQTTRPGQYSVHCQTLRDFTLDELQDLGQPPMAPRAFA